MPGLNFGLYEAAAAPGAAIGQGLMGVGKVFGQVAERDRELQKEKKQEGFTKTLAAINLYTKMGEGLAPEDRQKLYTTTILPLMASGGMLPEGFDQKQASDFIASISLLDKDAMKSFTQEMDQVLDSVYAGDDKKARQIFNGMETKYGSKPALKGIIESSRKQLDSEISYRRGSKLEVQKGLIKGDVLPAEPGEKGAVEYGGSGLTVRGKTSEERIKEKVSETEATTRARVGIESAQGMSRADREKISLQHDNEMEKLNRSLGAKDAEKKKVEVDKFVDDLLAKQLRVNGVYKHKEKGWVKDQKDDKDPLSEPKPVMVDVSSKESGALQFKTELLRRIAAEPDRSVKDLALELMKEVDKAGGAKDEAGGVKDKKGAAASATKENPEDKTGLMAKPSPTKKPKKAAPTAVPEPVLTDEDNEYIETVKKRGGEPSAESARALVRELKILATKPDSDEKDAKRMQEIGEALKVLSGEAKFDWSRYFVEPPAGGLAGTRRKK